MDYYGDAEIFRRSYEAALERNRNTVKQIKTFKKELEEVRLNLEENQKHLFQNAIVPIGNKAMMKGKLTHTNEIYVNLGSRWFVKTSAKRALEICDRMIGRCDDNLLEFEKETKLLTNNLKVPDEVEIFPNEDIKDIIEPYDEEYERKWREEHKRKVREYRKKEAENRSTKKIFERLDKLEAEEVSQEANETEILNKVNAAIKNMPDSVIDEKIYYKTKKKTDSVVNETELTPSDEFIIRFKHTENESKSYEGKKIKEVTTPTDIYNKYLDQLPLISTTTNKEDCSEDSNTPQEGWRENRTVIHDIVERIPSGPEKLKTQETRPKSKFKSRLQNR